MSTPEEHPVAAVELSGEPTLDDGEARPAGGGGTAAPACPVCGVATVVGDQFCEACGAALPAPGEPPAGGTVQRAGAVPDPVAGVAADPSRCACGGTVAPDGYCELCGAPAANRRDHWVEQPASWVGGVCDRGIRHAANEDGMALAASPAPGSFAAVVVCDGVSTAPNSAVGARAAAQAACAVLATPGSADLHDAGPVPHLPPPEPAAGTGAATDAAQIPDAAISDAQIAEVHISESPIGNATTDDAVPGDGGAPDGSARWFQAMRRAAAVAHTAAVAAAGERAAKGAGDDAGPPRNPPSCTFVAAVVDGDRIVTGSVGDSRAYWVPDAGDARQLTTDDSWAAELMATGVPREVAETGPHAHAITRWMGLDSPDPEPALGTLVADRPGWLLVCSDGLWNYVSEAADLARLVHEVAPAGGDPVAAAGELVAWGNRQGGHDNITVALCRLDAPVGGPDRSPAPAGSEPGPPPDH